MRRSRCGCVTGLRRWWRGGWQRGIRRGCYWWPSGMVIPRRLCPSRSSSRRTPVVTFVWAQGRRWWRDTGNMVNTVAARGRRGTSRRRRRRGRSVSHRTRSVASAWGQGRRWWTGIGSGGRRAGVRGLEIKAVLEWDTNTRIGGAVYTCIRAKFEDGSQTLNPKSGNSHRGSCVLSCRDVRFYVSTTHAKLNKESSR